MTPPSPYDGYAVWPLRGQNRSTSPASLRREKLGVERLLQELVDDLGVGLAAGRLHHLADEPAEQRGLGLVGRELPRIGVDHRLDGGLDGAGVGDLLQAAFLDQ